MGHSATAWDQNSVLEVVKDWNGIDQVVLRVPRGASAQVSLHGGQVVSWKNERVKNSCSLAARHELWSIEMIFIDSFVQAMFKPPKAMRGGIPICFPQFGNCGSLEQHGFARNKMWSIDYDPPPLRNDDDKEKVSVDLLLKPSEDDLKCWPHCYEFRLRVSLATNGVLTMISRVRNINGKPFSFSFAYHTYLSVSDIRQSLPTHKRFTEQGDAVTFESEEMTLHIRNLIHVLATLVDRIYLGSPNVIAVLDHEKKRTFLIKKKGLPDVVVWNPWEKKSKSITDLGDEYKQMVCVDGAVVERPITLKPGEEWTGRLDISAIPSTHFI
ncbi:Aldose 1-epimerase [Musa troglodytarum]|uniref:glucose-6-phosphate 1-epimerase n=1 Tax=Musa troglodytarum TaxID=320322 RepID=A0A9E7G8K1_9LILI|nr:Aldose 1-epimerase [Musa troglodytarum]